MKRLRHLLVPILAQIINYTVVYGDDSSWVDSVGRSCADYTSGSLCLNAGPTVRSGDTISTDCSSISPMTTDSTPVIGAASVSYPPRPISLPNHVLEKRIMRALCGTTSLGTHACSTMITSGARTSTTVSHVYNAIDDDN